MNGREAGDSSPPSTSGTISGVIRMSVELPDQLKAEVRRIAQADGVSEAEVIRRAIRQLVDGRPRRVPRVGLFASNDPTLAERVDEVLAEGFGSWDEDR